MRPIGLHGDRQVRNTTSPTKAPFSTIIGLKIVGLCSLVSGRWAFDERWEEDEEERDNAFERYRISLACRSKIGFCCSTGNEAMGHPGWPPRLSMTLSHPAWEILPAETKRSRSFWNSWPTKARFHCNSHVRV